MANQQRQMQALQEQSAAVGGMRQTHTGVNNQHGGKKAGLHKQKIMIEPGVYQTRTAALNVQYHGFDDGRDCEHALKVKVTLPEKWLDNPTPVSTLKAFFMKNYRKKCPDARLSKLSDDEIELAIKDESMFVFSKKPLDDGATIHTTFHDRQDIWAMGPEDWEEMDTELKKYRKAIVRALAHCHRSATDSWEQVVPVTTSRQLAPTNSYVIFTGWYKMQVRHRRLSLPPITTTIHPPTHHPPLAAMSPAHPTLWLRARVCLRPRAAVRDGQA